MSTRNRIPPALEPYLGVPPELSLVLLTSTLGCSANWLTARFVSSNLSGKQNHADPTEDSGKETAVILVSWMREYAFWRSEVRRTTGLDVANHAEKELFTFIDRLSIDASTAAKDELDDLESRIRSTVARLRHTGGRRILLVLDHPDVVLATASATSQQLNVLLSKLRQLVDSAVVTCAADLPMLAAATQSSEQLPLPIEAETAAFAVQQSHNARFIMSTRELDTGAAKDVSGVLRVTRGGSANDFDAAEALPVMESEALYLVQRDGSVQVFERGAVGGG